MSPLAERIVGLAATPGMTNAKLADSVGVNRGYVSSVLTRAGVSLSARMSRKERKLEGFRKPRVATMRNRPCMCCGRGFLSEGPHNRLCGPCRLQPSGWL
jgi:hypothetical protein